MLGTRVGIAWDNENIGVFDFHGAEIAIGVAGCNGHKQHS
jgi:hypothetical protein